MEATEGVRPTALIVIPKYPELPRVLEVREGDDIEPMITEMLGGRPDSRENPDAISIELGVSDVYTRDGVRLHVHTRPDAAIMLESMIAEIRRELTLQELVREFGGRVVVVSGPPGVCICGKCPTGDGAERPASN